MSPRPRELIRSSPPRPQMTSARRVPRSRSARAVPVMVQPRGSRGSGAGGAFTFVVAVALLFDATGSTPEPLTLTVFVSVPLLGADTVTSTPAEPPEDTEGMEQATGGPA